MKLVIISDTHMGHRDIMLPPGDVLIHCGDATFQGEEAEVFEFNEWLGAQDFKHKIFVPGNHDWLFQKNEERARALLPNAHVLIDEELVIDGVKFYGSPWQPAFMGWAFNLFSGEALREKWDLIPEDVDVLITHGPPYGILDDGKGCLQLTNRILWLENLKLHCFGHIHGGYGVKRTSKKTFINASSMNEDYDLANSPQVFYV